jgi:hypothetical protein
MFDFIISMWFSKKNIILHESAGFLCNFIKMSVSAFLIDPSLNLSDLRERDSVVDLPQGSKESLQSGNESLRSAHWPL